MHSNIASLLQILSVLLITTVTHAMSPDEIKTLIENETDPIEKVDLHINLGKTLLADPEEAVKVGEQGIELAKSIGYEKGEADLLNFLGVIAWRTGDMNQAIDFYQQSLELFNSGEYPEEVANLYGNIGIANSMLGQMDAAVENLSRCVDIRRTLGLKDKLATAATNLGLVYFYMGDYEAAVRSYLESAEILEEKGEPSSLTSAYNNLGGVYTELGQNDRAKRYFEKALEYGEPLNDKSTLVYIYGNLGNIDFKNGDYEAAIKKYLYVLDNGKDVVDPRLAIEALNALGNAYQKMQDIEQAHRYLQEALDVEIDESLQNLRLSALLSMASLCLDRAQADAKDQGYDSGESADGEIDPIQEGIRYALEGLEMAESLDLKNKEKEAVFELSRLYEGLGNYSQSLAYYKRYKFISDQLLNKESLEHIAEMETRFEVANKNREIENLEAYRTIQELKINEQQESMKAQRRLIIIVLVILLMILLTGLLFWKWNQARQRNIQNELLIRNLRTEQRLFRSQMNPHFIYNSLNSIQSFISSNESYLAEKYLAKFAKLMRGILENSTHEVVPFDKELQVIESYLELERVRFEKRFDFEIQIDDSFEAEFISIPPMLIQPFLENSILHGFANTKEAGLLVVSFSEVDECIRCEIDDNGMGREAAGKLPKKKDKTSLATQITNDRMNSISMQTGRPATMEIVDKYEGDGAARVPSGTRVILTIPLMD